MATKVEQLRQKAAEASNAFWAKFGEYGPDNLPNPEQKAEVDRLRTEMTSAQSEVKDAEDFLNMQATIGERPQQQNPARDPRMTGDSRGRKSIGTLFVENPAYQAWLKNVAPNGATPMGEGSKMGVSPAYSFKGFGAIDRRSALITGESSSSAGAFVVPDQYPELTTLGRRPLVLRDLVTVLPTGSDAVEYVRELAQDDNAAVVGEATAASGSSGSKPESGITFERVTTPVKTIANWIPASRRALTDVPQMRALVDQFLNDNNDRAFEDEILNGDGTGEHFDGIDATAGTQVQAWDTDLFTTLRKAKRKVSTVGRAIPTAYLFNPEDAERLDLMRDNVNRFYGSGPFGDAPNVRVWRLPAVECEAVPVGKGWVGDWRQAVIFDREQASIYTSDSHMDFFTRNLIAILAEFRAAFGVLKPAAFVEIDLTA